MYAQHHLGLCLCRLQLWEAAAEAFQRVLAHDSYSDQAHIRLGNCLLYMNRPEEALSSFEACWSESARLPALFGKAVSVQLLRRFDEAEALYEQVLELDSKFEEALSNLIAMSMEVLDLSKVQRYSLRLLEICPQSTTALQGLTLVAFERREFENAAGYFANLTENAPNGKLPHSDSDGDAIEYRLNGDDVARLSRTPRTRDPVANDTPGQRSY